MSLLKNPAFNLGMALVQSFGLGVFCVVGSVVGVVWAAAFLIWSGVIVARSLPKQ